MPEFDVAVKLACGPEATCTFMYTWYWECTCMKNMCLRKVYACTHGVGTGVQWMADTVSVQCAGHCMKVLGTVGTGVQWMADTVSVLCAGHYKKVLGNVRRCWAL